MEATSEPGDELADKMLVVFDDDELAAFFDGFDPLDPWAGATSSEP